MNYFGITDKGIKRSVNQDYILTERIESKECTVIVVCDGLGSSKTGGVASELAARSFVNDVAAGLMSRSHKKPDFRRMLTRACATANDIVYDYSLFDSAFSDFGTTIVGGFVRDDGTACLINVGDSRAYVIRKNGKERVQRITKDHSLVEGLVEAGVLTKEQARNHPQKNVITRAVGSEPEVESDYYRIELKTGDMLMLCSDGLSNYVSEEDMLMEFQKNCNPEFFCRRMIELTYENGAGDNVSVISLVR